MSKPKRSGLDWTPGDLRTLRECAKKKLTARVCAQRIGRTRGAVAYKAMVVGVRFRAINQPKGAQVKAVRTRRRRERQAERASA